VQAHDFDSQAFEIDFPSSSNVQNLQNPISKAYSKLFACMPFNF